MTAVRRYLPCLLGASTRLGACSSADQPSGGPAAPSDPAAGIGGVVVVLNAQVHTIDPSRPTAEAFAYDEDGVIIAVGSESEVLAEAGDEPTIIDARGNMVMPGFQDPHVHVPEAGINEGLCLLEPSQSLGDYELALADCAGEQSNEEWVRAAGASLFDLRVAEELPIDVLDRVIPDRPVLVLDDLGHAVWTNTWV